MSTDWSKYERYSMVAKNKTAVCHGDTPLGKAITKGLAGLEAKEKAGTIKPATAAGYKARLEALVPLIGKDEDSGLLQASQLIGGINRSNDI